MNSWLIDILLFPGKLYGKLTDRKATLYLGMLLIGIIDVFFPVMDNYAAIFGAASGDNLTFNSVYALVLIIVLGFTDVVFFSLPLFDLSRFVKKYEGVQVDSSVVVKVMKVYVVSHYLIIPVNTVLYFIAKNPQNTASLAGGIFILLYFEILLPLWFSAAVTRGVNTIFNFQPPVGRFSFAVIFLWGILFNQAFSYALNNWLLPIFRT